MRIGLLLLLSSLLLSGCSSTSTTDQNSLYAYRLTEAAKDRSAIKKVVIATVNYGQDSPSYIRDHEKRVDTEISRYLKANNFTVVRGNQFDSTWSRNRDKVGEYFDPRQGTFRRDRFNLILAATLAELKEQHGIDAIIFTDLIVNKVTFDYRKPHYATWHGVKRKPRLKNGRVIPLDFNWSKSFRAVSLSVIVFRSDREFIFQGAGGIEMVDHVSVKFSQPMAVRNPDLFTDKSSLNEGIQLALHPLIPMKNYPGESQVPQSQVSKPL